MPPSRNRSPDRRLGTAIPRFTIDLSLDPEERYVALARQYRPQIQQLTSLFDELLLDLRIPMGLHKTINQAARLMLRKMHSPVETAELRGISKAADIPIYLLVSLNLVLDLLMGCTSGAVKSRETGPAAAEPRMLHFRTLDWVMDPLRSVIVQLDYIESKAATGMRILGSSISYVGFVGVLTGVREGLSVSLNFRAFHDGSTKSQHFRFYFHHVLVVLGLRQSISSLLRSCLFGDDRKWYERPRTLEVIRQLVPTKHTTAAYLIFCNGLKSISMEKDFATAITRESDGFIVTTNHDLEDRPNLDGTSSPLSHAIAMQDLLEDSAERRNSVVRKWQAKIRREQRAQERASSKSARGMPNGGMRSRSTRSGTYSSAHISAEDQAQDEVTHTKATSNEVGLTEIEQNITVTKQELVRWTTAYPTTNECTHFAAILDPITGQVAWSERYLEPVHVFSNEE
jgi:hypothetical protein